MNIQELEKELSVLEEKLHKFEFLQGIDELALREQAANLGYALLDGRRIEDEELEKVRSIESELQMVETESPVIRAKIAKLREVLSAAKARPQEVEEAP